MTVALVRKLLRDVRLGLLVFALLLGAFQCLWVKITARISGEMVTFLSQKLPIPDLERVLFNGPGKIIRTIMGGESIKIERAQDVLSIGYVHPLVQTILCIWAIGRAAGAIAGEIDRGTMELLLAQPVRRSRVVLAHLLVDVLTIPVLCLSMWGGTWLGTWLVGPIEESVPPPEPVKVAVGFGPFQVPVEVSGQQTDGREQRRKERLHLDPAAFGPALVNVAALLFAVSGATMWLSAGGRYRWRVLGIAVLLMLVQFLINVVGQLWDALAWLRPFTVFYYYQPQQIILSQCWAVDLGQVWNGGQPLLALHVVAVLATMGIVGYAGALWTFCRRDLPAPL